MIANSPTHPDRGTPPLPPTVRRGLSPPPANLSPTSAMTSQQFMVWSITISRIGPVCLSLSAPLRVAYAPEYVMLCGARYGYMSSTLANMNSARSAYRTACLEEALTRCNKCVRGRAPAIFKAVSQATFAVSGVGCPCVLGLRSTGTTVDTVDAWVVEWGKVVNTAERVVIAST